MTRPPADDDTAPETPTGLLLCGNDPEQVWENALGQRLTAHELSCPHCLQVSGRASLVGRARVELAAAPVLPPDALIPSVMARVRAELRQGRHIALPSTTGPAAATELALASAVRFALDGLPTVRIRAVRVRELPPAPDEAAVRVPGATVVAAESAAVAGRTPGSGLPQVRVEVDVSLLLGADIALVGEQVRQAASRVLDGFGLRTTAVDLDVKDVHADVRALDGPAT